MMVKEQIMNKFERDLEGAQFFNMLEERKQAGATWPEVMRLVRERYFPEPNRMRDEDAVAMYAQFDPMIGNRQLDEPFGSKDVDAMIRATNNDPKNNSVKLRAIRYLRQHPEINYQPSAPYSFTKQLPAPNGHNDAVDGDAGDGDDGDGDDNNK
jgi:hypothetical protein